jgi:hypothetical protein
LQNVSKSVINKIFIFFLIFCPFVIFGQDIPVQEHGNENDTIIGNSNIMPPAVDSTSVGNVPKRLSFTGDKADRTLFTEVSRIDTAKPINYWQITERTGEIIQGKPDTTLTEYFHRTHVEGYSTSMAYLGNLGSPMESRLFFERADRSHFMFMDNYSLYNQSINNINFINTKIPHSNISYQRAGSRPNREERFQTLLAVNFGKKLNVGVNLDYLYARGFYDSQASRHVEWGFFSNYISDRHQVHILYNPSEYINNENGGISNDYYLSHPDYLNVINLQSKEIPVNIRNTWNQLKGKNIYLNYHYNIGFERNTELTTEDGDTIKRFIPVSAVILTMNYKDKKRLFYSTDTASINKFYDYRDFLRKGTDLRDSTSYWELSSTLGLSMREGFSSWAKFDLTAFLTQDFRSFTMMDTISVKREASQKSTYLGGELAKRTGKILRYNAQGSLGILGYNLGDINLSGHIETHIPVWNNIASLNVDGYIKNIAPTYYENHFFSKYFNWNNDFNKVRKVYAGGELAIPHTNTAFGLGVENVTNYIYFNKTGYPEQYAGNIQVVAAHLKQSVLYKAFHWDNRVVYQKSSDEKRLPLPDISLYSSMFVEFKVAGVLRIQIGGNIHYWTMYYAPAYEPATQQFKIQDEVKTGNYPLISGFVNCHLKQTRFFIEYYNAGASLISPPEYFSVPHYPVNPTVIKLGISVDFIN